MEEKGVIGNIGDSIKSFFKPATTIVATPKPTVVEEESTEPPYYPDNYDPEREANLHGLISALRAFKAGQEEPEAEKIDIKKFQKLKMLLKHLKS